MTTLDSYDEIPYDAVPITDTHPDHLHVIGRWFGVDAAPPDQCRVLELGCADGANIIPLAYYLPGSTFIGIELSRVQVDAGMRGIERLALRNVELRHGDVMHIGDELGTFDYIIAHGIYSWVPAAVRGKILQLCGALLAPHGIAYISYNTLPGWRGRSMVRDMLLHHCRNEREPRKRLRAAQEMLEMLHSGWSELDSPVIAWLKEEVAHLRKASQSYLFHEYLEETNEPVLFSDFIADAQRHGLRYLADSDLYTMLPATLGAQAEHILERFEDLIEQEQYMDFLRARPFRRTLLCRSERNLRRDLDLDALRDYGFAAYLVPTATPTLFKAASGKNYSVSHPHTQRALGLLARAFPNALTLDQLVQELRSTPQERTELQRELFSLFASRALQLTPRRAAYFNMVSTRPCAHRLARAQAMHGHVSSVRHIDIDLDPISRELLAMLDGTRTHDALVETLRQRITECENDTTLHSTTAVTTERIEENVHRLLALFARHGLLKA